MRKLYRILSVIIILTCSFSSFAQKSFFSAVSESTAKAKAAGVRVITPQKFSMVQLDVQPLKAFLWNLPSEKNINPATAPVMEIPMPNGSTARFHVWESSIQEPGLEAKFPEIKTFAGQGIDDPAATIRFDYTDFGFHAQILSPNGRVYIDPYQRGDIHYYQSYYTKDEPRYDPWTCGTVGVSPFNRQPGETNVVPVGPCRGTTLNTYRLAVACTGEYAVAVGGTTAALLHSAIVTTVNRVTGVYQTELTVKLVLIANNNVIEYLNAATDPFTGNNNANVLINESQTVIDGNIGNANYDVGHTFSTGGGGLAGLGVVCRTGQKASGITGSPSPTGDGYDIDYVAHEMGHEFGGDHSFNSNLSNCGGGNRNGATAYEVGSGTSIMAYAGICSTDDIQPHSDPYFHPVSFDEISTYISGTGGTCAVQTATGNSIPVITAMNNNNVNIPISTPFTLTATATDADAGDVLTYDWEEWDLGPTTTWNGGNANTTSPLFKSRNPVTSGSRTFPDITVILAGYPANPPAVMDALKGETLPTTARTMKFRLEVRDNRAAGGGIVTGGNGCGTFPGVFQVNTIATTGPFAVTVPNGGESYSGGSTQTVTWNVVGTDVAPISVANVKISYSTDGGLTYPTVLLASTPNDGSQAVTIPVGATTTARVKVEAVGNIFFDISNANFTVTTPVNDFAFGTPSTSTSTCPAGTPTVTIPTTVTGTFTTPIVLTATAGVPAGTTVTFAPNPLTPGSSTVATLNNANTLSAGTYTITVTGTAGTTVHTTTITYTITAGAGPAITVQPANQAVCAPAAATFSVTATGVVTYQWQSAPTIGGTYTNIAGATSASYTTPATTAAMNGMGYHVIVSTQCGSTTSANVLLTVNTQSSVVSDPVDQSACIGSTATFTVVGAGTGVTYQWRSATSAAGPFTNIPGATSASYTTPPITATTDQFYRARVITTICANNIASGIAQLTINTPTSITTAPTAQIVCAPNAATFTVAAAGTGNTYQWQVSTVAVPAYTNIAGATSATYNTGATTTAMSGNSYHVVTTGACNAITSGNVTLTVNTAAAITGQPSAVTVCNGTSASFTVTTTGTGATYQWQSAPAAGGPYTNIAGATGATYTIASTTPAQNGTYYHVVVTTTTCAGSVTSNNVLLTVNTVATITAQPTDQSACIPNAATFTVAATGTGLTYQWQVSTDGGATYTNIAGATSATYTITPTAFSMNGNKYRVQILSTCSPSTPTTSTAALLTVNNPVSVTQNPVNQSGCTGDNYTFSVTAVSTGSITYQWQVSYDGGVTYTNIAGATSSTYTITGATSNLSGTKYRVIVSGVPCGIVTTPGATLTLSNRPAIVLTAAQNNPINPSLPTGLFITVSPASGNYVYSWRKDGVVIPNTLGTTNIPDLSDNFGTYQVGVTDITTGCSALSNAVTISPIASSHLFIYPNPVTTMMQVRYYSASPATHGTMLNVYDNKGARVVSKTYQVTGIYGRMDVDMTMMSRGTYYVEIRDASGKRLASAGVTKE